MTSWNEIEAQQQRKADRDRQAEQENREFYRLCARVFGSQDGMKVLAILRRATKDQVMGPDVADGALRWHAGRAYLLGQIETWTAMGLNEPAADLRERVADLPTGGMERVCQPGRPAPARTGWRRLLPGWFHR